MRRPVALFAIVLAAPLLASCKGDAKEAIATTTTFETTTTTIAVSSEAAQLEAKLLDNVPAGYKQEADSVGDTGPSDLAKAIRDDGSDDARDVLTNDGFVAGYQRYWTKGENEIALFLYQFSNPAGASHYVQRQLADPTAGDAEKTATEFAVTGAPGAKGYLLQSADGPGAIVAFTRGNYMTRISLSGTDSTAAVADALAAEQYGLLA